MLTNTEPAHNVIGRRGRSFPLLAEARVDAPAGTEVHRFVTECEKDASVDLRLGRSEVMCTR